MSEDVKCPFCSEQGFDLIGLKCHLENYCQPFRDTLSIEEERRLVKIKRELEANHD